MLLKVLIAVVLLLGAVGCKGTPDCPSGNCAITPSPTVNVPLP